MLQENLMAAIAQDDLERVKVHIEAGANPLKTDQYGRWAIIEATLRFFQHPTLTEQNVEMIRYLISLGVDVNQSWGPNEETALHLAVAAGSIEACRELVAAGISMNAQNADGDTALHITASQTDSKPQVAAYLLSLGIDPKIKNHKDRTALQDASSARNLMMTTIIKSFTDAHAAMKNKHEEKKLAQKKKALGQIELFEGRGLDSGSSKSVEEPLSQMRAL